MKLSADFIYMTDFRLNDEQEQLFLSLLELVAEREELTESEVVITFCDNDYIRFLNKQFRNIDQPTDVLSFPMDNDILGDIVISIPKAEAQALEYKHSFNRELGFLIVHGFLHLLGYDHHTAEDEKVMFALQEEILQEKGLTR